MEITSDVYGETVRTGDVVIHHLRYGNFAGGIYLARTKQKMTVLGPGWIITSRWWNFIKAPEHVKQQVLKNWNSSTIDSDHYYIIRNKAIEILGAERWEEIMKQLKDD